MGHFRRAHILIVDEVFGKYEYGKNGVHTLEPNESVRTMWEKWQTRNGKHIRR